MTTTTAIEVAPRTTRQPGGLGHLRLFHQGCEDIPLNKHRNVLTEQYTLQCLCGLVIRLPANGPAAEALNQTADDQLTRKLPSDSFVSSVGGEVEIVTRRPG